MIENKRKRNGKKIDAQENKKWNESNIEIVYLRVYGFV